MKIRVENEYGCGHESTHTYTMTEPADLNVNDEDYMDDFFWGEYLYEYTGDGHGIDCCDGWYTVTILEADTAALVGQTHEYGL